MTYIMVNDCCSYHNHAIPSRAWGAHVFYVFMMKNHWSVFFVPFKEKKYGDPFPAKTNYADTMKNVSRNNNSPSKSLRKATTTSQKRHAKLVDDPMSKKANIIPKYQQRSVCLKSPQLLQNKP